MKYEINGNIIKLFDANGGFCFLDAEDEDILKEFECCGITGSNSKYFFIERSIKNRYGSVRQRVYLHVAIMIKIFGLSKMRTWFVDHKDRNRFNNLRSNLRLATASQNGANADKRRKSNTGYRGVTEVKGRKLLKRFNLSFDYKNHGYFETAIEAAKEYDKKSKEKYGEFAFLNFKDE